MPPAAVLSPPTGLYARPRRDDFEWRGGSAPTKDTSKSTTFRFRDGRPKERKLNDLQ